MSYLVLTHASVKFLNLNQDHPSQKHNFLVKIGPPKHLKMLFFFFFLSHALSIRFDYQIILKKTDEKNYKTRRVFPK